MSFNFDSFAIKTIHMNNFNCNDKQNNLCELQLKKECNTTVRNNLMLLKKKTRYWNIIWKLASHGCITFFFELKFIWIFYYQNNKYEQF